MSRIDLVETAPSGVISVRKVLDDGTFWRGLREPGEDVSDLPTTQRALVQALWTPDFIAAWKAMAAGG